MKNSVIIENTINKIFFSNELTSSKNLTFKISKSLSNHEVCLSEISSLLFRLLFSNNIIYSDSNIFKFRNYYSHNINQNK